MAYSAINKPDLSALGIPQGAKQLIIEDAIRRYIVDITQGYRPGNGDRLFVDEGNYPGKYYATIDVGGQTFVGTHLSGRAMVGAGIAFLRAVSAASLAGKSPEYDTIKTPSKTITPPSQPARLETRAQVLPGSVHYSESYVGYGHGV